MTTRSDIEDEVRETEIGRKLVELPHRPVAPGEEAPGAGTTFGGFGLAIYAVALIVMCLVGIVGVLASTLVLVQPGNNRYSELKAGSLVEVRRLAPMRDAGLLGFDQVPNAWHDESQAMDGTVACALLDDALVRVADGVGQRLDYGSITGVALAGIEKQGTVVTTTSGDLSITCAFGPDEGGERFDRQVRAAAKMAVDQP